MEDHSKDNAFKRLLHFKRSQKHRARPNNPTPHGAGHPFPAPSPSSFGPYFEASDARSRSITPTRASLRDVEKRGSPLRRGISPTSSKRRTGFKSLYETANSHVSVKIRADD